MKRLAFGSLVLLGSTSFLYADDNGIHVVKRGESLSTIAHKQFGKPVYTRAGALEKLLQLNPEITNPDRIRVGQTIYVLGRNVAHNESKTDQTPNLARSIAAQTPSPSESAPQISPNPISTAPTALDQSPAPNEQTHDEPASRLRMEGGLEYFRIDAIDKATGSSTTLLSNPSPQFSLAWDLDWTKNWTSRLKFNYSSEKILDDTSSGSPSLQDASGSRFGFEIGAIRNWSERSHTGAFLGFKERLFEHMAAPTQLVIDRVASPDLRLSHEQDLAKVSSASFGVELAADVILPGRGPGYSTETGYSGVASVYLKHELKSVEIRGRAYYGFETQNTTITDQKTSSVGALFGLTWKLGD